MILDKKAEKAIDVEEVRCCNNRFGCQITKEIRQLKTKYDDNALMMVVDSPKGKRNYWPTARVLNQLIDKYGHDTDKWINEFMMLTVVQYTGKNNQSYERIELDQEWLEGKLYDGMPGEPVPEVDYSTPAPRTSDPNNNYTPPNKPAKPAPNVDAYRAAQQAQQSQGGA